MNLILTRTVALLIAAIAVALIARRLRLPYTVGLVLTGIVLAAAKLDTGIVLTHELIFDVILPPLLFEAAIHLRWKDLCREAPPILVLAVFGTVLSAFLVAAGLVRFLGWSLPSAALFGVLIAATDPVSVIAMFKDHDFQGAVQSRVRLLVESESLFNDGVAAVLFAVVLAWAEGGQGAQAVTGIGIARSVIGITGGGVLVGVAVGRAAIAIAGRTSDHLIATTLTTVAAYGSFLFAEQVQVSGVLAVVAAGLVMGNAGVLGEAGRGRLSPRGRETVVALWEFAAFIANSLVFLLIGQTVASLPLAGPEGRALAVIIGLVLAARLLTVYPLCLPFRWSRWAIPAMGQHILWWGGLRGALALALALSLPATLPGRDDIELAAFAVVAFSVVVQGVTMPLLFRRFSVLGMQIPSPQPPSR